MNLRSEKGEVLVAVMVAMVVLGAAFVGMGVGMESMRKAQARGDSMDLGIRMNNTLREIANRDTQCDNSMRGPGDTQLALPLGPLPAGRITLPIERVRLTGQDTEMVTGANIGFNTALIERIEWRETLPVNRMPGYVINGTTYTQLFGEVVFTISPLFASGGTFEQGYPVVLSVDNATNAVAMCTAQNSPRSVCHALGGDLTGPNGECEPRAASFGTCTALNSPACPAPPPIGTCEELYIVRGFTDFQPICDCILNCNGP